MIWKLSLKEEIFDKKGFHGLYFEMKALDPKISWFFFFFFFLKGTWCRKITFFVYQKKNSIQNGCLKKYFLRSKNHFLKERIRKKEKSFGEKIEKCPFGRPFRVLKVKLLLKFFFFRNWMVIGTIFISLEKYF